MKSGIYKITNLLNNKVYIGQSKNIPNRFKGHIRQRSRNYPLYNSFRKYGIDNFKFEVIEYADINILDELEIKYIKKYKSLINENGYNIKDGGNGRPNTNSIVYDNLDNIINDISNTNIFIKDIAKKYNISSSLVSSINNGLRWFQEDIEYPIRKKESKKTKIKTKPIVKQISYCSECGKIIDKRSVSGLCYKCYHGTHDISITKDMLLDDINKGLYIMDISKKYNVSHTTIRKYFKKYNIENINNGRQKFFGNQWAK